MVAVPLPCAYRGPMLANRSVEVDAFMDALDHPMAGHVQRIRLAILDREPQLVERIKWRAPSLAVDDVDRVTFHLRPTDRVSLILHRGVRPVDDATPFRFDDPSGLLSMITDERGQVVLAAPDVDERLDDLLRLVHDWVRA